MKVSANPIDGYIFNSAPEDAPYLNERFKSGVIGIAGGLTLKSQESAPECYISGVPYNVWAQFKVITSTKTFCPITKAAGLFELGYGVSVELNEIQTLAQLAVRKSYQKISSNGRAFYANHIPQLFQSFQSGVIVGVEGEYRFRDGSFFGYISIGSLPEVAEELL